MILHIFDPLLGALPLVDASPLLEALCLIGLNYSDLYISELENILILNLLYMILCVFGYLLGVLQPVGASPPA